MSKKDPILEKMKKELKVTATSKCNRLNYLINMVIRNQGKPVSKVTAISNLNITIPGTYTYYVHATAINNPNCSAEQPFTFTVHPLLPISLPQGVYV